MIQLLWRFSEELLEPPSDAQSPHVEETTNSLHELQDGTPLVLQWDGGEGDWEYLKWHCAKKDIAQVTFTAQLTGVSHRGLRIFARWHRLPTEALHDQESAGANCTGEHQIVIESPVSLVTGLS